jgi:hypothetical protein
MVLCTAQQNMHDIFKNHNARGLSSVFGVLGISLSLIFYKIFYLSLHKFFLHISHNVRQN